MCDPESPIELKARRELDRVLGQRLERVCPDDRPSPDYRLVVEGVSAAFEVKGVVSEDWIYITAGMNNQQTSVETDLLGLRWRVLLTAQPLAQRLIPPPDFKDDDEAQIASLEAQGFVVKRKADRINEWRTRNQTRPSPLRIRGMAEDLIPEFRTLERHGIRSTVAPGHYHPESHQAVLRIARRTRGAICRGHDPIPGKGLPAGIEIVAGYGFKRTGRPDTLASRIQEWLDSDLSDNLLASLDRDEYREKHGVLVFDDLEPERIATYENPESYLPRLELDLPDPVDVIWAIIGRVILRYSELAGWQRFDRIEPD